MTKEEMIEAVNSIKQPVKQKEVILQMGNELGLNLKPTSCGKCLRDYMNIIKETLGLIESAADESDFNNVNSEYRYIRDTGTVWKGVRYNQDTPVELVREFVKLFPVGFYEKIEKEEDTPQQEVTINNEE